MRPARLGVRAAIVVALTVVAPPVAVLAAEPSPTPIGGDPRSAGEGPGLVGDPLFAIGLVVLIAVAAVVLTTAWVRLTARRNGSADPPSR